MIEVYLAEPYRCGAMSSLGDASYMLIRQFQFPHSYSQALDHMAHADHDRIFQNDQEHASKCFKKHTKTGDLGFESWIRSATNQQIMGFLKDILKSDQKLKWTGFRIMGTVHCSNGYPVWTLQLFAKGQRSTTEIYYGEHVHNATIE